MSVVLQDRERAQMETRIKALEEDAAKRRCARTCTRIRLQESWWKGQHVGFPSMSTMGLPASAYNLSSCCLAATKLFFPDLDGRLIQD